MTGGQVWLYALVAVAGISAISLVGALTLVLNARTLQRSLIVLISFAAGALLGDAFLHLLPEISESAHGFDITASMTLLGGVVGFFILEKVLHWHHAHVPREEVMHPIAVTNLVGDALHNFVDGAIVAGSFLVSGKVGLATTLAVALHEIPQELGDFGIMMHAGLKPRRALFLNFATALASVVGAVAALSFAGVENIERAFVPFAAGAFVYIAATDLIPELHKEPELGKSFVQLGALLTGVAVMASLLLLE